MNVVAFSAAVGAVIGIVVEGDSEVFGAKAIVHAVEVGAAADVISAAFAVHVILASAAQNCVVAAAADEGVVAGLAFDDAGGDVGIELDVVVAIAGFDVDGGDVGEIEGGIPGIVADHELIRGDEQSDIVIAVGAGDQERAIGLKLGRQQCALFQSLKHGSLSRCDTVLPGGAFPWRRACALQRTVPTS